MNREEITATCLQMVKEEAGHGVSEDFLFKSLSWDSLDVVGFVADVETKFEIEITNEELVGITCVRNLVDVIERKLTCPDKS